MQELRREVGLFGAMMMGLGSIIGTGIFVSVGISAGLAGASVLLAILLAAGIATCNGLNSAQLAANYPVSGGTYEYAYRTLNPQAAFLAGWAFLLAKSASAATAALGFAGYLLDAFNIQNNAMRVGIAFAIVIIFTGLVLTGIKRSNLANIAIVSLTLLVLAAFFIFGLPSVDSANFSPILPESSGIAGFLQATALMFVAYTGYGRIATLGEEVKKPEQTIPRAMIVTLAVTALIYMAVASIAVGTIGASALATAVTETAAPLEAAANSFGIPFLPQFIAFGAITAMLGVLLNLILGLSRVLLAMGRRHDMPPIVAQLNQAQTSPNIAVVLIGLLIAGLVLLGNVKTTWSFSAFTVLIYYSITNLSALQLSPEQRLYPKWIAWLGLAACLFLAFWVELQLWLIGVALLGLGLIWQQVAWTWFGKVEI